MKKLEVISATQIELFRKCPRLWYDRYVLKNKQEPTPQMLEGLEVHQAIEAFLKTGEKPKEKWVNVVGAVEKFLKENGLTE